MSFHYTVVLSLFFSLFTLSCNSLQNFLPSQITSAITSKSIKKLATKSLNIRTYASVDCQRELDLINALLDPSTSFKKREQIATSIANDPGSYCPFTLLATVSHFLEKKEFEKASVLASAALLRSEIDARISKDISLTENVPGIAALRLAEIVNEYVQTKVDKKSWGDALTQAIDQFEEWDRATPRNYDDCWLRPHSIEAFTETYFTVISQKEKQEIIEDFYKEIKQIEDDYKLASLEDDYFFDPSIRTFYSNESRICFILPPKIKPLFNHRTKQYSCDFSFSDSYGTGFWMDDGKLEHIINGEPQQSLSDAGYTTALSHLASNQTLEKVALTSAFDGFRLRTLPLSDGSNNPLVNNDFYIKNDAIFLKFYIVCNVADEQEFLDEVFQMLNSIKSY